MGSMKEKLTEIERESGGHLNPTMREYWQSLGREGAIEELAKRGVSIEDIKEAIVEITEYPISGNLDERENGKGIFRENEFRYEAARNNDLHGGYCYDSKCLYIGKEKDGNGRYGEYKEQFFAKHSKNTGIRS